MGKLRFGLYVASARKGPFEVAQQAVGAERAGFDSFWFTDHLIDDNIDLQHAETWTSLTLAATRTSKIILGSAVTDPYRRHPSTTAQTVATLDHISKGRAALGIGAGEAMNLIPFGIQPEDSIQRLREAILVIKRLWLATNSEPANFDGRIFSLNEAFLQISPLQQPGPPIYGGALSRSTREVTGEVADGWLPWINSRNSYAARLQDVKAGAKRAGRDINELDLIATLDVAISEDREEARRAALIPGKAALIAEGSLLREMGYKIQIPRSTSIRTGVYTRETMREVERTIPLVPDEAVEEISAFGSVDNCISKIEQFIKAGAKHILVANQGPDESKTIQLVSAKIMPYLRESYSDV